MKTESLPSTRFRKPVFEGCNRRITSNQGSARKAVFSRSLKHTCVLIAMVLLGVSESNAGLKIYYIRHAEAGHNVVKEWANVPEEQWLTCACDPNEVLWPAFIGDSKVFTPKGEMQRTEAADKLQDYHFDFIAVSSMWRTRNTILPYLKETGAWGEIWPELHELYASSLILSPYLPAPDVNILGEGAPVELPPEEAHYFVLRPDGLNDFKLPPFPADHADKEAETAAAQVVLQRVLDMIQERFGGSDKSILLVGHGSSGRGILRMLLMDLLPDFPSMTNTGVWMVEEQANGEFGLKMFNDVPIEYCNSVSDPNTTPIRR